MESTSDTPPPNTEVLVEKFFDLLHQYDETCEMARFDSAIESAEQALEETLPDNPDKAVHLSKLATLLAMKFESTDNLHDLQRAIFHGENAISGLQDHPGRAAHFSKLSDILLVKFKSTKSFDDLENFTQYAENAVAETSLGDPDREIYLSKLVTVLMTRFRLMDNLCDLQDAIIQAKVAVSESEGDPGEAFHLSRLADILFESFNWTNNLDDLGQAIFHAEKAVAEIPQGYPDTAVYLFKLITLLTKRFEQTGNLEDLMQAISYTKKVVPRPESRPDMAAYLNPTDVISAKLKRTSDLVGLEHVMFQAEKAASELEDYLDRAFRTSKLADTLFNDLELGESLEFLKRATLHTEKAIAETPPNHPYQSICLSRMVKILTIKFRLTENLEDLNLVIHYTEKAVSEPQDYPGRASCLCKLAEIILEKFKWTNDLDDIEHSIWLAEKAISEPQSHLDRAAHFSKLADILVAKFKLTGDLDDLGQAILHGENSITETPHNHPSQAVYLSKLAAFLEMRSEFADNRGDLDLAVLRAEKAVSVQQDRSSKAVYLSKLAALLKKKFNLTGNLNDLSFAISHAKIAASGHPNRVACRNELLNLLKMRFDLTEDLDDLKSIISLLKIRHIWMGDLNDLRQAISLINYSMQKNHIILPRAALWLDIDPREKNLETLKLAISHPEKQVQEKTPQGHKIKTTQLKLLSNFLRLPESWECLPKFSVVETFSVREYETVGSIKLGRLVLDPKFPQKETHDPPVHLDQTSFIVSDYLKETPTEEWGSHLQIKVSRKGRFWTSAYKAQTHRLTDPEAIFATAYAIPKTHEWLGTSKTVYLVAGYQICIPADVVEQAITEKAETDTLVEEGHIYSVTYQKIDF